MRISGSDAIIVIDNEVWYCIDGLPNRCLAMDKKQKGVLSCEVILPIVFKYQFSHYQWIFKAIILIIKYVGFLIDKKQESTLFGGTYGETVCCYACIQRRRKYSRCG